MGIWQYLTAVILWYTAHAHRYAQRQSIYCSIFSSLDLYYLTFPTDIIPLKCLVVAIYALEAAQMFMLTDTAFNMFAYGYVDLDALNTIGMTWVSIAILGAICESYIYN